MLRALPDDRIRLKLPTLWGLDPTQLHDRYWASKAICVVRPGEPAHLPRHGAELYMLTDSRTLALFPAGDIIRRLYWGQSKVTFLRLHFRSANRYRESVVTDHEGRFLKFARTYGVEESSVVRIALTRDRSLAQRWRDTDGSPEMWRRLRRQAGRGRAQVLACRGRAYDRSRHETLDLLVKDLIRLWENPSRSIEGIRQPEPGVWVPEQLWPGAQTCILGRAWVGWGRQIPDETVLGPAVLWDVEMQAAAGQMRWEDLDPTAALGRRPRLRAPTQWRRICQRIFDIVFAMIVLAVTLPLYPLIMLAIWLEDGGPFLFAHRRETLGGREFGCLKFRSMRKDADRIKTQLQALNRSDGPQFFVENDPRVTRVGRFLRRTNLDELPQFINVLRGEMSVVGPRPSPRAENQCCPAWREARLSVRPGVTGLWQVCRTRREGLDFQEWIRFDVEYVERASWSLDLWIIWRTLSVLAGR